MATGDIIKCPRCFTHSRDQSELVKDQNYARFENN